MCFLCYIGLPEVRFFFHLARSMCMTWARWLKSWDYGLSHKTVFLSKGKFCANDFVTLASENLQIRWVETGEVPQLQHVRNSVLGFRLHYTKHSASRYATQSSGILEENCLLLSLACIKIPATMLRRKPRGWEHFQGVLYIASPSKHGFSFTTWG